MPLHQKNRLDEPSAEDVEPLLSQFGLDDASAESDQWLELARQAARIEPLRRLGRYELLQEVSRGGQGIIYRARNVETGFIVAIKRLVSGAMASPNSQRRLERELESIASLKHCGIVEALGLEIVEGQPVLAMTWIDGISITEWAKGGTNGRRSPREIVAMLRNICHALQHAHQRGVIHRDLKPSNILVDASAQPHLLDFGLAKLATAHHEPALTQSEQFIGTLRYAPPEQLAGRANEVDVRSDVFSLGVIAYQMLTGRAPFPSSASAAEALQAVDATRVPRPSAAHPQIDRELDTIILKAMALEPEHRYQSVDALDADLSHWEKGEPILARGQTTAYLLKKLIRRHKVGFGAGVAIALLVITGGIFATIMAAKLETSRREEHQARLTAEKVSAFLHSIIAASDPVANPNVDVTARQLLNRAAERLTAAAATELAGQPAVQASLHHTIGVSYMNLGALDVANDHLTTALSLREDALGDVHDDVVATRSMLATLRYLQRQFPEAETFCRAALEAARTLHGESHVTVAQELNNLAAIRRSQGSVDEAETLFRQALEMRRSLLGENHPDVAETLNNLGNIARLRGNLPGAEELCRQVLDIRRQSFGDRHVLVAQAMGNLGVVVGAQGRVDESEDLMTQAIATYRALQGDDHPNIGVTAASLGQVFLNAQRYASAEPVLREALRIRRLTEPPGQRIDILVVHWTTALVKLQRFNEAEPELTQVYDRLMQSAGLSDTWTRAALLLLIELNEGKGNLEEAERYRALLTTD